jgi:histidyl-tRNA synthetase
MEQSKNLNYNLPSGFDIELTPAEKRLESYFLDKIRTVFERYGFTPIETPAVERLEILQAKGNQGDNIIYGINPIIESLEEDKTKKDGENRALKFDQTVPLAAYIARHLNDLIFPFARYQKR